MNTCIKQVTVNIGFLEYFFIFNDKWLLGREKGKRIDDADADQILVIKFQFNEVSSCHFLSFIF